MDTIDKAEAIVKRADEELRRYAHVTNDPSIVSIPASLCSVPVVVELAREILRLRDEIQEIRSDLHDARSERDWYRDRNND